MRLYFYIFSLWILLGLTACQPAETGVLTEKDISQLQKEITEEQKRWDDNRTQKKAEIMEHHKIELDNSTTPPSIKASFRFLEIPSTLPDIETVKKNIEQFEKPAAIKTLCKTQHPLFQIMRKKNLPIRWAFIGSDDQEISSFTLSAADCKN